MAEGGFSLDSFSRVIRESPSAHRPVAMASFLLNRLLLGGSPASFRMVNALLHGLCGALLFLFLRSLLRRRPLREGNGAAELAPFFAALLWLCHPLQTQAVSYVVQRMAVLSALFTIAGLLFWMRAGSSSGRSGRVLNLTVTGICFLLALGSKETAVAFPFALLLTEAVFPAREAGKPKRRLALLGLCLAALAFAALAYGKFDPLGTIAKSYEGRDFTLAERLLTQPRVILNYLSLVVFPLPGRFTLVHDMAVSRGLFSPWQTAPAILLCLALPAAAIALARRHPYFSFAVLWFFLWLFLESSFPGLEMVFDHRAYIPDMMLGLPVAFFLLLRMPGKKGVVAVLTLLCLVFSVTTLVRNRVWADGPGFWEHETRKNPASSRAWAGLGLSLMEKAPAHLADKAITAFSRSAAMDESYLAEKAVRARMLSAEGKNAEAKAELTRAEARKNQYVEVENGLGAALAYRGRLDEALAAFDRGLALAPGNRLLLVNKASVLAMTGKREEALAVLEKARDAGPEDPVIEQKLAALRTGAEHSRKEAAPAPEDPELAGIKAEIARQPDSAALYNRLGARYRELGNLNLAVESFEKALFLSPDAAEAYSNLGLAYIAQKKYDKAEGAFQKALAAKPGLVPARYNLMCLYSIQGRVPEAGRALEKLLSLGFSDLAALRADPDLANLRSSELFQQILSRSGLEG
ncbi:MAG: tetratricopeptide repeat protein [Thermodesulfobacteriota bacterium]